MNGASYDIAQPAGAKVRHFLKTLFKQKQLMLMSVPMLMYVLLFNYAPLWGWIAAFEKYEPKLGPFGSEWKGLYHFYWLFGEEEFLESIRNTLAMSVINLVLGTVSSVLLAILLNEVRSRLFKPDITSLYPTNHSSKHK